MVLEAINTLGPWTWFILGLVLLGLEILAPGTFFLWFGVAALAVGCLAFLVDWPWQVEVVLFLVLAFVLLFAGRRFFARRRAAEQPSLINERAGRLVGTAHVLAEPIVNGHGRIRVDDTMWRIAGPDLPSGRRVTVTGVEGAVLRVAEAP